MLWIGIPAGLLAAAAQAWSYLCSRRFVAAHGGALRLLALAHVWMGIGALVLLPVFWFVPAQAWEIWNPLLQALGCYLLAQFFFFWTVSRAPASRIAPLMGAKIVVLALLVQLFGFEDLGLWHWCGVGLTVLAVWAVHVSGERLGAAALLGVLATICCFAGSDLGIKRLVLAIHPDGGPAAGCLAAVLIYSAAGLIGLVLMLREGLPQAAAARSSLIYACAWFVGMFGLFTAIASTSVVLAIMLQALRGPLTIVFGALWSGRGGSGLEQQFDRRSLSRQLVAALLVTAGTVIYGLAGV